MNEPALALAFDDVRPFDVLCDSRDEERWHAERRKVIGASEAATVLGEYPWSSALTLWSVKTGLLPAPDLSDNEAVFWGHELEETIVRGFGKRCGRAVVPFGLLLRSTRYPWLAATPDALTTDDPQAMKRAFMITKTIGYLRTTLHRGFSCANLIVQLLALARGWWPLQIKNIGARSAEHWENGVPLYYRIQCTQEALVFGATRATGAALITGQTLAWDDIDVDEDGPLCRQLVSQTRAFHMRNLQGGVRPPADDSAAARATLDALYPLARADTVQRLDGNMLAIAEERDDLKEQIAELKKRVDAIDNRIRDAMEDCEAALLPDGSGFTLKTVYVKEYVSAARSYRDLRRKQAKGEDHADT